MTPGSYRRRWWALGAIGALCAVGIALYVVLGSAEPSSVLAPAEARTAGAPTSLAGSQLLVRAVDRRDPHRDGRVFVVKGGRPRQLAGEELDCGRVYFAAGRGLCLASEAGGVEAAVFDSSLQRLKRLSLAGVPVGARVSADGRFGAITVVRNGNVEPDDGGLRPSTTIIDMRTGRKLANLADFTASGLDGQRDQGDSSFECVTFTRDAARFYASMSHDEDDSLVEGDLRNRSLQVLREGVECPSLSPDGRRIAYETGPEDGSRLRVLDLGTMHSHAVAGYRPVAGQAEWLDNDVLVYSDGFDVYTVPADGSGEPRLVLRDASSPATLRKRP